MRETHRTLQQCSFCRRMFDLNRPLVRYWRGCIPWGLKTYINFFTNPVHLHVHVDTSTVSARLLQLVSPQTVQSPVTISYRVNMYPVVPHTFVQFPTQASHLQEVRLSSCPLGQVLLQLQKQVSGFWVYPRSHVMSFVLDYHLHNQIHRCNYKY